MTKGERINDTSALEIIPDPLDQRCGWCGQASWLRRRAAAQTGYVWFGNPNDQRPLIAGLYECSGCHKPSLAMFQAYVVSVWRTSLLRVIPAAQAVEMGLPDPEIEADRVEAWACFHSGQYRAAVLMARSALQRAVRSLDPFRGKLHPELDNLVTNGVITRQLRANVDEVRISGNDVAHPEELGGVTKDDAEDSLTFLDDFLTTTIMTPERQRKRQQARESASSEDESGASNFTL